MHSVGWAFLWEFWRRYRNATVLALGYTFVLVLVVHAVPARMLDPGYLISLAVPLWGVVMLNVATFGQRDSADILARESPYPRRLFAMPVRTAALAGWPMAIGATAMALLWLVLGALILRPAGWIVPLVLPAVVLAALVAWGQALLWCPYPLTGLRVVVAVPVLGAMALGVPLSYSCDVPPSLLLAVFAALVPAGYLVAVFGIASARRGDVPVWNWPSFPERAGPAAQRPAFASAADALFWLDWRRNGYVLPFLIGLMLVPQLGMILIPAAVKVPEMIAGMFLLSIVAGSPAMAAAAGASLGNTRSWGPGSYAMPAFIAARPVTSAEIIAVKLHVALRVFLITGALTILAIVVVVPWTPIGATLAGWASEVSAIEEMQGGLLLWCGLLTLAMLSFKTMLDHLFVGLSGRIWFNIANGVAFMVAAIALACLVRWIYLHPEWHGDLLAAAPWLAGLALALKLGLGTLVGWFVLRRGLVAPQTVMRFATAFIVAAAALFALAFWLTPPQFCSPLLSGCIAVVALLPLVRLGLAPLALDWNRHR